MRTLPFAFLLGSTLAAQPSGLPGVAALMDAEAAAGRFSGMALVAQGDKVLFQHSAGYAIRSLKVPVRSDTRFQLASLGKLFTTVAIGQLVEQGKVGLDDPITRFLPAHPEWAKVKVRHLLSHTAGFGSYWGPAFEAKRTSITTVKDYFPFFEREPLAFEPGSRFAYSNVGFILLGAIVEKASGEDFFAYVQAHVFTPAGMVDSGYFEADEDVPRLALGYMRPPGWPEGQPLRTHSQIKPFKGGPAGDAVSSARDLHRFMAALHAGRLLKPETTRRLWTPVVDRPTPPGGGTPGLRARYGLGFVVNEDAQGTLVGHTGGFPGTGTSCFLDPRTGLIALLLCNVDFMDSEKVDRAFRAALPRR